MRLQPVCGSSNVVAVGHDERDTLVVRFRGGGAYRYTGVPFAMFRALLAAPSKGAFLAKHITRSETYPCVKLTQEEVDALEHAPETTA